ncbi:hypothetical protein BDF21DRAFT_468735 [Thamnidium elegans]|nr:hypothetical protein BDF21DRAFT_468735 [Thamnidium elegans]
MVQSSNRYCSLNVNPNRIVATLTGIQVMRTLWQIWDAIDNDRPASINDVIMPTIYISCILSTALMTTGVIATWSVYQLRVHILNICWWVFYMLTIFSFLNACTNLSVICLGKEDFMSGCITENVILEICNNTSEILTMEGTEIILESEIIDCQKTLPPPSMYDCKQLWENSVIWSAIIAMLDLLINLAFSYALYKCRVQYRLNDRTSGHLSTIPPPPYSHQNSDSEMTDFQTIEIK